MRIVKDQLTIGNNNKYRYITIGIGKEGLKYKHAHKVDYRYKHNRLSH